MEARRLSKLDRVDLDKLLGPGVAPAHPEPHHLVGDVGGAAEDGHRPGWLGEHIRKHPHTHPGLLETLFVGLYRGFDKMLFLDCCLFMPTR